MSDTTALLRSHAKLTAAIREGEDWEASYKASPKTFKLLLRQEAELQADATLYLMGLSDRLPSMVDWSQVPLNPVLKAAAVPPADDEQWRAEMALLADAVADNILALTVIGANAGEDIYGVPLGINTLDEFVLQAAATQTANLVSGVTKTTRTYIQSAIKQSIAQGDDLPAMIERIRGRIASPVRATMIAQTEAVNAYQLGLDRFAVESGALSSVWDALSGACSLCAPLDGVEKPMGELFTLGNGEKVKRPPGHTRCRCGRYLNYP